MGALPKRKISKHRKGKRRKNIKREFAASVKSQKSEFERLQKNQTKA